LRECGSINVFLWCYLIPDNAKEDKIMNQWDMEVEVAVIGSGGGALTAALSAHEAGAEVIVLERTDKVGGTTAQSGGAIWIPMNRHMKELGASDSREEALKYCLALAEGRAGDDVVEAYVDNAVKALELIETKTPVRFKSLGMPDYHAEIPGGKAPGRGLDPQLYDLKNRYLQGTIDGPVVQPHNEGDGTMMASEAGADMIQMHEVWWFPSVHVPGDLYDGKPFNMMCFTERHTPHTILVNKMGRRFVNEAGTYNDMAKAMFTPDENRYGYRNYPCWAVMDSQYRQKYHVMGVCPGDPDPEWLMKADTLEELAKKVGIDPAGLVETVYRYNGFCKIGKDLDYSRGENLYERFVGDPDAPHPVLGTVEKAPFYVVPVLSGALGTKGGPRIDKNGQARNVRNQPITGLYACGNVASPVSGPGYWGPGGTIGPGVCFGYLAGIHAAKEAKARR
jgi:succinate dehydrogenase/fumarate reductase flavoprotein subunit